MEITFRRYGLSELSLMSSEDRKQCINELHKAALDPTNEQLEQQKAQINNRIIEFESKYNLSSKDLVSMMDKNQIQETKDICSWLILLKIKNRFDYV